MLDVAKIGEVCAKITTLQASLAELMAKAGPIQTELAQAEAELQRLAGQVYSSPPAVPKKPAVAPTATTKAGAPRLRRESGEVTKSILAVMGNAEMTTDKITAAVGLHYGTVHNWLRRSLKSGLVELTGPKTYRVADAHPPDPDAAILAALRAAGSDGMSWDALVKLTGLNPVLLTKLLDAGVTAGLFYRPHPGLYKTVV